jgi:hypothetical protein
VPTQSLRAFISSIIRWRSLPLDCPARSSYGLLGSGVEEGQPLRLQTRVVAAGLVTSWCREMFLYAGNLALRSDGIMLLRELRCAVEHIEKYFPRDLEPPRVFTGWLPLFYHSAMP